MKTKRINKMLLLAVMGFTLSLSAKEIPRHAYINNVPITYPKITSQSEANKIFGLYGDKNDPFYKDIDPVDGIDDLRFEILEKLAVRFAPYLAQNTTDIPMDFKYFCKNPCNLPLYADTWDISQEKPRLVYSNFVDFCSDDPQLLLLVKEFHPEHPAYALPSRIKRNPSEEFFKVLYFDFPGHDEKSWRQKYEAEFLKWQNKQAPGFAKTYVHMFISDEESKASNTSGYEFVIQYWFFYPYNDGGNNHEGDWEHINVVISPLDMIENFLFEEDIDLILQGEGISEENGKKRLAIKRLEYYFHYKVMVLDFFRPNVYKPKNEWIQEIKTLKKDRKGKSWIWKKIRSMAYKDGEEREINTHPFVYIGGDCTGYEQILTNPGGKNRNSHGCYPFPGFYREVGPASSSEKITVHTDLRSYYKKNPTKEMKKKHNSGRGNIIPFDNPLKIAIIPDWERIIDQVLSDEETRKNWFWLILPIRFGYPASSSPLAGLIDHTNTGNLSTLGPAYSEAWNRVGGTSEFDLYVPHKLSKAFPLDWQSNFSNGLGFFNLVIPTLQNIPPFCLVSRALNLSISGVTSPNPVFYPKETIPSQYVGISFGMFQQKFPGFLAKLAFGPEQINEIQSQIKEIDPGYEAYPYNRTYVTERLKGMTFQLNFHMGTRLISENTLRYSKANMSEYIDMKHLDEPFRISSDLDFWEVLGSFRYNLNTGKIQPYVKAGYGWTWFRVKNIAAQNQLIAQSPVSWVRKPSLCQLNNLLPNSWHYGFGIEIQPLKSFGILDMGLKLEYLKNHSSFSSDTELSPWGEKTKGSIKMSPGNLTLSFTINY